MRTPRAPPSPSGGQHNDSGMRANMTTESRFVTRTLASVSLDESVDGRKWCCIGERLLYTARIDPHGGEGRIRTKSRTWQCGRRLFVCKSLNVYTTLDPERPALYDSLKVVRLLHYTVKGTFLKV
jgi:hypothetical protein